jgi:hypothetical protein
MMWKIVKPAMFGAGMLLLGAAGAQAQTASYPGAYWQNYPAYNYAYGYPAYGYPYASPYQSYSGLGYAYPAPRAYSDPYVGYRPYSDNAGPKASTRGGF